MVQLASHSTFFSSSRRIASSFALGLVLALSVLALSAIGTVCSALRREAKSAETANLRLPRSAPQGARRANRLASRFFPLPGVRRIFQKNVFSKTTPAGSGGTPLGIFVM